MLFQALTKEYKSDRINSPEIGRQAGGEERQKVSTSVWFIAGGYF